MKKKFVKFSCFVLSLLIIVSLIGCSSNKDIGSNGVQEQTPDEPQGDNKDEKQEISFTHMFIQENPDANGIAFNTIMEQFKKDNPNIVVNEEALSHDTYETKIKTLAAGNEMPDLFVVKGSMTQSFIDNGLINSLDDILDADAEWKNRFYPDAFDDFKIEGKIYGIPFQLFSTSIAFYNKDIFNESGVESFPKTWSEFEDAIEKIKAKGYVPIAMGNKGKWLAESCITSTLGDRFTGTEWFNSIKENKGAKFTDQEFIDSLAAFQDLAKMDAFNSDMNSIDNMQQRTLYYNKKAAMFFEGAWALTGVESEAPEDVLKATELALLPSVDGGKGDANATSGGSGWAYNMNSKLDGGKKDAAVEVLKALTSSEFAKIVVENNGNPAIKPVEYDKDKISPLTNSYIELMDKSRFVPIYDAQLSASIIEVMNSGLQELLINAISPEDLAKKIQSEYEKSN